MMDSLKYRLGAVKRKIKELKKPILNPGVRYSVWVEELGEVHATFDGRNNYGTPILKYKCIGSGEVGRVGVFEHEHGKTWQIIEKLDS